MDYDAIATIATIIIAAASVGVLLLRLEGRVSRLDSRVSGLDARVSDLESRMTNLENRMVEFGERLARIEGLLEGHFSSSRGSDKQND